MQYFTAFEELETLDDVEKWGLNFNDHFHVCTALGSW